MASATAAASTSMPKGVGVTGTQTPASPTASGSPSQRVTTTGVPHASASTAVLPNDSSRLTERLRTSLAPPSSRPLVARSLTAPVSSTASSSSRRAIFAARARAYGRRPCPLSSGPPIRSCRSFMPRSRSNASASICRCRSFDECSLVKLARKEQEGSPQLVGGGIGCGTTATNRASSGHRKSMT